MRNFHKTKMTDYFTFSEFYINNYVHDNSNLNIELMCHPGIESYSEELNLLKSDWFQDKDIKLISYNDL